MATPKKRKINLLVQEEFEHTTLGRILNWSLSAGRIIVIATELVVILAFLSRFWLDKSLTDLNNKNAALATQINASSPFEEKFRNAQKRLSTYQKLEGRSSGATNLVREISSFLPADVSLTKISFSGREVDIRGIALSEEGLAGFVKALKDSDNFDEVSIGDISLGSALGQTLNFVVRAQLKNK